MTTEEKYKEKNKRIKKDLQRYRKAYQILICYFDSISDEEQPKVVKQLTKLGV